MVAILVEFKSHAMWGRGAQRLPHGQILGLLLFKIELLRLYLLALKPFQLFISAGIKIVYLISYLIYTAVIEKYLISKVLLLRDLHTSSGQVPNLRSA